ncbi:response regulator [Engelhardtia mirabilis]|uniref:DNA-binding response regulator MtrA n=1 Tax=Engelhardtia mirabilis TaxID=2528011 RepID=A0A518BLR6_9BACT|nr:DNA-binding response regulator MtrA [Planctomycetes bacterium Pla133]QDV02236.1 DNA-binding response regulator MtrA [Planctomycetes bacterium Pla86]
MRLEDLTPDHLRLALDLYRELAWPDGGGGPRLDTAPIERASTVTEALEAFERGDPGDDPDSRRFTLRLGNQRYPFMKFVLQEHLVANEFFLSVDTHDNLDVGPEAPDFDAWEELKRFNRALKDRIEDAWDQAGLPTHHDLLKLLKRVSKRECEEHKRRLILIADDEEMVAEGIRRLLAARGYDAEVVHDGRSALERLQREPRPDLLLLDVEMPGMDGKETLRRLRADPNLTGIPVLMATAAAIDLAQLQEVAGLLHKPYPRQVLFAILANLLGSDDPGS